MIEISNLFEFLNTYFRPILLISASCFAVYFSIQKFGNKITVQYKFSMGLYSCDRISNVVIANNKDKTINIWSLRAIFDNEYQLELDTFDPPLILKPYESMSLVLPEYSKATIGSDDFQLNCFDRNIKIYMDIGDKLIECCKQEKKGCLQEFTHIDKHSSTFNGHIYNDRVSYILVYLYEGTLYTAFICGGLITNEWEFTPNYLGDKELSINELKSFIIDNNFDSIFSNYTCYKVDFPSTEVVFSKVA